MPMLVVNGERVFLDAQGKPVSDESSQRPLTREFNEFARFLRRLDSGDTDGSPYELQQRSHRKSRRRDTSWSGDR